LQPWALIVIKIGAIMALAPLVMMYLTWFERKVIARMQNRLGPDRVGVYGLAQPLADGVKMLLKEDITPTGADRFAHALAPVLALVPAILLFAVLPLGNNMIAADLNVGLLYLIAVGAISTLSIFVGGWASRSKFPVIGALRSVAQIIAYEVPQVLSVVTVIMVAGTLSLTEIVRHQAGQWFIATPWGFAACLVFFLCGVAEVNRTPFDMAEAESELVGGFHTEYSGMKFALWYMAEFLESFAVCAFTVTLFLGGWLGPAVPVGAALAVVAVVVGSAKRLPLWFKAVALAVMAAGAWAFGTQPIPSWAWFLAKTYLLMFVLVWFRGTFPRLRVDQLMGLAWKFLLPLMLVNIFVVGIWLAVRSVWGGALSLILLLLSFWILVRINQPAKLRPRVYLFAE
jgi:NADH-quinone oxidoreductase subunit H